MPLTAAPPAPPPTETVRPVVYRTSGRAHGPITRLMRPGDLGELVKPFVFLDFFEAPASGGRGFAAHPHSGIATLTTLLAGGMTYADSTGKSGTLPEGAVEWMRAGGGVWHKGGPVPGGPMRGYQLWLALPADLELAAPESLYVQPRDVPSIGPARVLLGSYQGAASPIAFPVGITYLHVRLPAGARWVFKPDPAHDVAWLTVNAGRLHSAGTTLQQEIAVFAEGAGDIALVAEGDAEFVIGSAAKHPHDLVTGYYSVHTSPEALAQGERGIAGPPGLIPGWAPTEALTRGERGIAALANTPAVAALRAG